MKKCLLILCVCSLSKFGLAQEQEAQQLLLNWEKLMQFKKILQNMKNGYQILYKGYTTIKDISEGNFRLHKTFLNALSEVSPAVRKYRRISDIINYQFRIVKDCKSAFNEFKSSGEFIAEEMEYMDKVYNNLMSASLKNTDELSIVITAGKLRMSDDERLQAIDRIYAGIEEQYSFLQEFNNQARVLVLQRKSERAEIESERKLRGY